MLTMSPAPLPPQVPQSPVGTEKVMHDSPWIIRVGSQSIGSGTAVRSDTQQGGAMPVSLQVLRVIKGDEALAGTPISALWANGTAIAGGGSQSGGVWFLRRAGQAWNVMPVVQGAIDLSMTYYPSPAGPIDSACAYDQNATEQDKLAAEISSGIEASRSSVIQFNFLFESGLLDDLNSQPVLLLYKRLAGSLYADKRLLGLSGLIRQGDATALERAAQTAAADQNNAAEAALLSSVRGGFRNTDPTAVAIPGAAATNSSNGNMAFRQAAAHALAAIHTAPALPFMAALLDDPDPGLRVEAAGGIGSFANGLAVQTQAGVPSLAHLQFPAVAAYKNSDTVAHFALGRAIADNESFYVSFWRSWWSQNRVGLGY